MDKDKIINRADLNKIIAYCGENKYAGAHRPLTYAAILLSRENFQALSMFYTFFCYCDDEIDQAQSMETAKAKVERFRNYYSKIVNGDVISFEESPPFAAVQYALAKYNIPLFYFENLLASMDMDINNHIYENFNDLILYCYLATGLGMAAFCYVVGVNNEDAVHYAMYYGISSQLTNTARDILEDAKLGRVYVPVEWLKENSVAFQDITNPVYYPQLHNIAKRIAKFAETYRIKGDHCLPFFSFSNVCTLSLARQLDTYICNAICNQSIQAWEKGITVSLWNKSILTLIAVARAVEAQRFRVFKPFKPVPIQKIWDFQAQHGNEEAQ